MRKFVFNRNISVISNSDAEVGVTYNCFENCHVFRLVTVYKLLKIVTLKEIT